MTNKPDITRRDFLNGMALSLVAGGTVSPIELWQCPAIPQATPLPWPGCAVVTLARLK